MNPIADEMNELMHYGVKRRSGRYPWGSGDNPYQRSADFLARYEEKEKEGKSQKEIADEMGVSTTDIRVMLSYAKHERRNLQAARARSLKEDGLNPSQIAREMGFNNESSVRALLNEGTQERRSQADAAAKTLAAELKQKGFLDVGKGAEATLGISANKLEEALLILQMEGYEVYGLQVPQATNPRQKTTLKVLCPPETKYKDAWANIDNVEQLGEYHSNDGGKTFKQRQYPQSIDSKRVDILYAEDGGKAKDGLIEIRRGVDDLNLGNSHYAQVRILVDGDHYLKGMAVYSDDLPDGVDVRFNTSKSKEIPMMKVLKSTKENPANPFGAYIPANGQSTYIGKDGKEHLSAINKIKWEGDWDDMDKNLSSQFLSKQSLQLIDRQLNLTYADYADRYDKIMQLTNPTIQRKMLEDLADTCDGAVVHLKAAALPRQKTQVIIPINNMKDNEIYAPNFRDGEQVALVRYPHGGTFEIPILTVNNRSRIAKSILPPDIVDAVGINSNVAERLSGADFDGDQVVVIPVNYNVRITSTPPLRDLQGFDPKTEYEIPEGDTKTKRMTSDETQKQMGIVSNLITDMTLKGATESEIARAVKHSMVVIDAEKHGLDYKRSEKDNGIAELKEKYQRRVTEDGEIKIGGASTLLSRRKQDVRIPERRGSGHINKETGIREYNESGRTYIDKKTGKEVEVEATTTVKLLSVVDDVRTLSSGTPQEDAYANYANRMKALAAQCRKDTYTVGRLEYSPQAAKIYKAEVDSLTEKLNAAEMNAPLERQANIIANAKIKMAKQSNPSMDKKEEKKLRQTFIEDARKFVGSTSRKDSSIVLTDREWEAIQSGAISDTRLKTLLKYVDIDDLVKRAMPREGSGLSDAVIAHIRAMNASGYTNQEIADALKVSTSDVFKYTRKEDK